MGNFTKSLSKSFLKPFSRLMSLVDRYKCPNLYKMRYRAQTVVLLFLAFSFSAQAAPKYKSTPSGLKYTITKKVKKAPKPQPLHTVQLLFTSSLADGTVIASSLDPNNPMEFIFGNNEVLKGWDEAVNLLKVGEKGSFILPPNLAYGDKKAGKIPANSTIHMQIELISSFPTFFNPKVENYQKTNSGLQYIVHNKKRSNEPVKAGNYVFIHYIGFTVGPDGKRTIFDGSRKSKSASLVQCGVGKFFKGLDEGLLLTMVGDSITIIMPPELGYGKKQNQLVPPNSTLGFDIYIEQQVNPFSPEPTEMIRKEGFSYGFIEKKAEINARMNEQVEVSLIGYYTLPTGLPYIFESSLEKKQTQVFRLGKGIENPAWLYVLQQCGAGDQVKFILDPEMARTELKKLIPENVSVIFEFQINKILPPSFLPVEGLPATDLGEGLELITVQPGLLETIDSGEVALVHYTGFTIDSLGNYNVFDSSFDRGQPFQLTVGAGQVIKGWDKGLLGRKEQEQFRLKIPAELGYGKAGVPPLIMPNETLYFDLFIIKSLPPLPITEPTKD